MGQGRFRVQAIEGDGEEEEKDEEWQGFHDSGGVADGSAGGNASVLVFLPTAVAPLAEVEGDYGCCLNYFDAVADFG
jgi:hypothetical protein